MLDLIEKAGICSPVNIRLYKMGLLTAAELKAQQEDFYDFHAETIEGRALVRERLAESDPLPTFYPFHANREKYGHWSLHKPPYYFNYDSGLAAPFLADVKLRELNNKATILYLMSYEKDHAN